jgi:hypothetical protein
MSPGFFVGVDPVIVPTVIVDRVNTQYLYQSLIDLSGNGIDHSPV